MAIPSEYYDHYQEAPNIKDPMYLMFASNYANAVGVTRRHAEETVGPLTNAKTGTVLHPDMYTSYPDGLASPSGRGGRENAAQHATQKSCWLPGLLGGENIAKPGHWQNGVFSDATFFGYGQKGTYLAKTYGYGHAADPMVFEIEIDEVLLIP